MWIPLLALLLGFLVGKIFSFPLHPSMATYLSVATLATLDSTLGGIKGVLEKNYNGLILMTGFFINGTLAAFMVFLGDWIGVDLYYVAIFVFGLRIFQNLAVIRRILIHRFLSPSIKKAGQSPIDQAEQSPAEPVKQSPVEEELQSPLEEALQPTVVTQPPVEGVTQSLSGEV